MLEEYIREINSFCENHTDTKIYIYGAGAVGKIVNDVIQDNIGGRGYSLDAFLVSDASSNRTEYCGKKVIQFDKLDFTPENSLFLIGVQEKGAHFIRDILEKAGAKNIIDLPANIFDYDKYWSERKKSPTMEITPHAGCKVNCRYCPQNLFLSNYFRENKKRLVDMSFEHYKKCLAKLPKNTIIEWAGFVEPFLNPYAVDMMVYTYEQGYEQSLFTTLVGMTMNDFERIKNIPFSTVCLHTPDKKNYANIPITKEYLELLKCVANTKRSDGEPFITTANCQNEPHPDILPITSGKMKIYCELSDRAGSIEDEKESRIVHFNHTGKIWCSRADKLDHNILLPDGTVVLCCNDFGMQHTLGNLLEQNYEDIINGEEIKRIKHGLVKDETLPIVCRKCIYATKL